MALIIKPSQLEESAKLGAQFRHCIHEEPEIGLYLPKTQEKIVEALKSFGIKWEFQLLSAAQMSQVSWLSSKAAVREKLIGLRADSDALPWKKKPVSSGAVKFR